MAKRRTCLLALLLFSCGGDDSEPATGAETEGVTWCQALGVLEASCQRCHADPQQNGAPFPLVSYEHTQAPYYNTDKKIFEQMRKAVADDFMPAQLDLDPPVQSLSCAQKTTLLRWIDEGAESVGGLDCTPAEKTLVACDPELGAPAER